MAKRTSKSKVSSSPKMTSSITKQISLNTSQNAKLEKYQTSKNYCIEPKRSIDVSEPDCIIPICQIDMHANIENYENGMFSSANETDAYKSRIDTSLLLQPVTELELQMEVRFGYAGGITSEIPNNVINNPNITKIYDLPYWDIFAERRRTFCQSISHSIFTSSWNDTDTNNSSITNDCKSTSMLIFSNYKSNSYKNSDHVLPEFIPSDQHNCITLQEWFEIFNLMTNQLKYAMPICDTVYNSMLPLGQNALAIGNLPPGYITPCKLYTFDKETPNYGMISMEINDIKPLFGFLKNECLKSLKKGMFGPPGLSSYKIYKAILLLSTLVYDAPICDAILYGEMIGRIKLIYGLLYLLIPSDRMEIKDEVW